MELKIKELTKDFKDFRAVDHVSCSMEQGVYGLLGVNGAGKTTLMRMICTLLRPTEGSVTWNGKDIFKMDASYRKVLGYLPQDFGFYPDFTVQDYMMYISSIKGIRPMTAKKRTEKLLEQVGLRKMKKRKMRNLSGGMQRRVGIAQAMLNDPQILILDEPTAGLDPNERIRFRNLISELAEDRLVLLSTHIVSDVEFIANDILLMKDGKFFMNGTVWSCTVPRKEADRYLSKYLVSNVKTVPGGAELRILAKRSPAEGAVMEEATLEDAFLLYFGEKAGEEHDGEV